ARVVVGLVPDELAVAVLGERNTQVAQMQEGPGRDCRLCQCVVPVHGAAGEQGPGHLPDQVALVTGEGELVVGLLVRSGVAAGTGIDLVGDDHGVFLAEAGQALCCAIPGRAGPHDDGVPGDDGDVEAVGADEFLSVWDTVLFGHATASGAIRSALAAMVRAGFNAADDGKNEESASHRLSISWARHPGFRTLVAGSWPATA